MESDNELYLALDYEKIIFKVVLLGQSGTGKTSIITRYTNDTFGRSVATLSSDLAVKTIDGGSKTIMLNIWDTVGLEQHMSLPASFARGAQGIILVYDITDVSSFQKLKTWIDLAKEQSASSSVEPVMILVGNKIDLEKDRKISKEIAKLFSEEHNLHYIEASAKTSDHVDSLFSYLVDQMLNVRHAYELDEESLKDKIYFTVLDSPRKKKEKNICC